MNIEIGTSGYSYKEWKGSFYPDDIPASGMLRFYSERFPAVEINNTFYRMPARKMLEQWTTQVPEHFQFSLKAPQQITHRKRLSDCAEDLAHLLEVSSVLGHKRGPFLFQLPPYFRRDDVKLREFLNLIPKDTPASFEFRHVSWMVSEVNDLLAASGAALCIADTDESEKLSSLPATAEWGYLRLRRCDYSESDLDEWAERILQQPWRNAWVFFKHEEEGKGPALAAKFREKVEMRRRGDAGTGRRGDAGTGRNKLTKV